MAYLYKDQGLTQAGVVAGVSAHGSPMVTFQDYMHGAARPA